MSKLTHTPGPWSIDPRDACCVVDEKSEVVARTFSYRWESFEGAHESQAINAHLIAAAPELLSWLTHTIEWGKGCSELVDDPEIKKFIEQDIAKVREVIANAEGGAS